MDRSPSLLLVPLRWSAVVAYAFAGGLAFASVLLHRGLAPAYFGLVAALALFNVAAWLLARDRHRAWPLFVPLAVDAVALTALLVLTGGIRNPFACLLLVPAGLGAMLLAGRPRLGYLALLGLCLALLYWLRDVQTLSGEIYLTDRVPLVALGIALVAVWAIVAWLSSSLARSRAELDRLRAVESRIDRLRALGALTAELCHRLATPLNTIKLRVARLGRRQAAPAPDVAALTEAVAACEQALRRIAVAPLDTGALELREVELAPFVGTLLDRWRVEHASPVRLQSAPAPLKCRLPPAVFRSALENLLDNAARVAPPGTPVDVELAADGAFVSVSVRDDGPGFPAIIRERVGTPFLTTREDGTGLGLYHCMSLCEALSGDFRIGNSAAGGAVATMRFPAASESVS